MKVYFIGAGPGDPELITLKAQKILARTKLCLYAGSLINKAVLSHLPDDAEIYDSAGMDLEQIKKIFELARDQDRDLARLHTGDLSVYSAVNEQINILNDLEIAYELIPGISCFQASAAVLERELTVPGGSQTLILTRMAGRTPVPESEDIRKLAAHKSSMCIFLSTGMIKDLCVRLCEAYPPDTPAAVVYRASWPDQKVILGHLSDIAEKTMNENISKTALVMVGEALGDRTSLSLLYDKNFSHEYRK